MFDNGTRIYPRECLVDLVQKLRNLPFVTLDAIRLSISKEIPDATDLSARAERAAYALNTVLNVEVVDGYALESEPEDVAKGQRDAERLAENILNGVGVSLIRHDAVNWVALSC